MYRILSLCLLLAAPAAHAAPLETFRDCDVCPEMLELPLGSFWMGARPNEVRPAWVMQTPGYEVYRRDDPWYSSLDELPRHVVTIDVPLAIGITEVTYDQWLACARDGGCRGYVPPDRLIGPGSMWIGGSHPVLRTSYDDAQAYVAWLNERIGTDAYRLPTEAEWEYAARAGTVSRFPTGDTMTALQANFSRAATEFWSNLERPDLIERKGPVPVTELDAENDWGLRHMSGNAGEITGSCYTERYLEWSLSSRWIEESQKDCEHRVVRGGYYGSPLDNIRAAERHNIENSLRLPFYSFRVAKEIETH